MTSYEQICQALGDPTRRRILETLRTGPRSVSALAEVLPVSRPAVSQHLRVLAEAGLVGHTSSGTRNIYHAETAGLTPLRDWLDGFWQDALDSFAEHARVSDAESAPTADR